MNNEVQTQNREGAWVPAIPEPFFGRGKFILWGPRKCLCYEVGCKKWFPNRETYRGHYALIHILKLDWP